MYSHQATSILVVIIVVLFIYLYFFVEVQSELPLYFKCKTFQEVVDYPPFGHVVEIVDHPTFVKVLMYIFLSPCPF